MLVLARTCGITQGCSPLDTAAERCLSAVKWHLPPLIAGLPGVLRPLLLAC